MAKKARWSLLKPLIALSSALTCLSVAAYAGWHAWIASRAYDAAMIARPMELTVDLSKPGKYTTAFYQSYDGACRQSLHLVLDQPNLGHYGTAARIAGLRGTFMIQDSEAKILRKEELGLYDASYEDAHVVISLYDPVPIGNYTAVIDIQSGTDNKRDTSRRLYGRYLLCGIEYLPIYFFGTASLIATVFGLTLLVGGLGSLCNRWRVRLNQP